MTPTRDRENAPGLRHASGDRSVRPPRRCARIPTRQPRHGARASLLTWQSPKTAVGDTVDRWIRYGRGMLSIASLVRKLLREPRTRCKNRRWSRRRQRVHPRRGSSTSRPQSLQVAAGAGAGCVLSTSVASRRNGDMLLVRRTLESSIIRLWSRRDGWNGMPQRRSRSTSGNREPDGRQRDGKTPALSGSTKWEVFEVHEYRASG